jgi:hypothetical protein
MNSSPELSRLVDTSAHLGIEVNKGEERKKKEEELG